MVPEVSQLVQRRPSSSFLTAAYRTGLGCYCCCRLLQRLHHPSCQLSGAMLAVFRQPPYLCRLAGAEVQSLVCFGQQRHCWELPQGGRVHPTAVIILPVEGHRRVGARLGQAEQKRMDGKVQAAWRKGEEGGKVSKSSGSVGCTAEAEAGQGSPEAWGPAPQAFAAPASMPRAAWRLALLTVVDN